MSKKTRQQAILEIVSLGSIPSQAVLARELKRSGFDVTQATLSRDIAELNLVKSKDGYTRLEDVGEAVSRNTPDLIGTLRRLVVKVVSACNQVVIKTSPGGASAVAAILDRSRYDEIVGTLAGNDTLFIVTPSDDDAVALKDKIVESLG